ncbi:MAG: alpha/beta-type small acid-soluble spore protein [Evtepia sp.]
MATKQSSSSKIMVPRLAPRRDKFKMEAANEVGVDLKKGYNGSMTTREAGSIGGQMVNACVSSTDTRDRAPQSPGRRPRNGDYISVPAGNLSNEKSLFSAKTPGIGSLYCILFQSVEVTEILV